MARTRGPVVGVGAVVFRSGKALMVRRAKEPLRGRWLVPGGTVFRGERLQDAVVRETREETGVVVAPREVLTVVDRMDSEGDALLYHFVIVDFLCQDLGGEAHAASDAEAVAWVGEDEFERYDVPQEMRAVLLKGRGRLASLDAGA
jgi:8-oxo-dGTP diphosphatase